MNWKKFGQILEWVGAIYFVGFALFGIISLLVLVPKYQSVYDASGQAAIFSRLEEIIGPLVILFLIVSAAAWYHGKELSVEKDLNWYDKLVALALLLAIVFILTPQLYLAVTSLIPAIKG